MHSSQNRPFIVVAALVSISFQFRLFHSECASCQCRHTDTLRDGSTRHTSFQKCDGAESDRFANLRERRRSEFTSTHNRNSQSSSGVSQQQQTNTSNQPTKQAARRNPGNNILTSLLISVASHSFHSYAHRPNICHSCSQLITTSQFIRVNAFKFHTDHFTCITCKCSLHGSKFHHKEGQFYCQSDYVKKFCHTCRHCVASDTAISLATGAAQSMDQCSDEQTLLLGFEQHSASLVAARITHQTEREFKQVMRIRLADGRSLTCTPDHAVLCSTQQSNSTAPPLHKYTEAQHLSTEDCVACGCESSAEYSDSDEFSLWQLSIPTHSIAAFNYSTPAQWHRALAFARLIGLMYVHLQLRQHEFNAHRIRFEHRIDARACAQDVLIVNPQWQASLWIAHDGTSFAVQLPQELVALYYALFDPLELTPATIGFTLPPLLFDTELPNSFAREFAGAMLGAIHLRPVFTPHTPTIELPALLHFAFESHHAMSASSIVRGLAHVLQRCDLPVSVCASQPRTATLSLMSRASPTLFMRQCGVRYNVNAQLQFSVAQSYWRQCDAQQSDSGAARQWLANSDAAQLLAPCCNAPLPLQLASAAEASPHHHDDIKWLAMPELESICSNCSSTAAPPANESAHCSPAEAIGESQLSTVSTTKHSSVAALRTFSVPVASIELLDEPQWVYDITVPGPDSFLANGFVVHNCQQKIASGSVIQAFGGYYHPDCFVCSACSKPFVNGKYYEKDSLPYCEEDYFVLTADKCDKCNLPIRDSADLVKVSQQVYHSACLSCVHCGINLTHKGSIYQKDGAVYCKSDYLNFFTKICTACGTHILKHCISVNDEFYHPDCLLCSVCHVKLDKYICILGHLRCSHHTEFSCDKLQCSVCDQTIEDDNITLSVGKRVHEHCYTCAYCQQHLNKATCKLKDGNLCCPQCIMKKDEALHSSLAKSRNSESQQQQQSSHHSHSNSAVQQHANASTSRPQTGSTSNLPQRHSQQSSVDSSTPTAASLHSLPRAGSSNVPPSSAHAHTPSHQHSASAAAIPAASLRLSPRERSQTSSQQLGQSTPAGSVAVEERGRSESSESNDKFAALPDRSPRKTHTSRDLGSSTRERGISSGGSSNAGGRKASRTDRDSKVIEWKKGELIGKGSFGKVYMAMNSATGELIAVKQVRLNTQEEAEQATAIQNEIALMENLRHPNIVGLLGTQRNGNKLNILMEFVPGKSLDSLLEKFGHFSETVIQSYTKQLLEALAYCHGQCFVCDAAKARKCAKSSCVTTIESC